MRAGLRVGLVLLVGILATAGLSAAQSTPGARNPRVDRVLEALLIWRLVDDLDLSEPQIARIFPQIKALKMQRLTLGRRKIQLQRELKELMQAQPRDEHLIRQKIAELESLRQETTMRRRQVLREIQAALTLDQQARFAVLQETFEAETLRLLQDIRRVIEEGKHR